MFLIWCLKIDHSQLVFLFFFIPKKPIASKLIITWLWLYCCTTKVLFYTLGNQWNGLSKVSYHFLFKTGIPDTLLSFLSYLLENKVTLFTPFYCSNSAFQKANSAPTSWNDLACFFKWVLIKLYWQCLIFVLGWCWYGEQNPTTSLRGWQGRLWGDDSLNCLSINHTIVILSQYSENIC